MLQLDLQELVGSRQHPWRRLVLWLERFLYLKKKSHMLINAIINAINGKQCFYSRAFEVLLLLDECKQAGR